MSRADSLSDAKDGTPRAFEWRSRKYRKQGCCAAAERAQNVGATSRGVSHPRPANATGNTVLAHALFMMSSSRRANSSSTWIKVL